MATDSTAKLTITIPDPTPCRVTHVFNDSESYYVSQPGMEMLDHKVSFLTLLRDSFDLCSNAESNVNRLRIAAHTAPSDNLRAAYRLIVAAQTQELIDKLEANHKRALESIRLFSTVLTVAEQEAAYNAWIARRNALRRPPPLKVPIAEHIRPVMP